jgi:hypothetical protein
MNQEPTSQRCARPSAALRAQETSRMKPLDVVQEAVSSRLFLMTTLGALSGQIPALAADGVLANPTVVVTVGLTVVAGVGAFVAAVEEVSLSTARGRAVFGATAALSVLVNVAAAGVGALAAQVASLDHLRYFAAAALGLIAWEIASGDSVEAPGGVPVPGVLVAAGVLVEALA